MRGDAIFKLFVKKLDQKTLYKNKFFVVLNICLVFFCLIFLDISLVVE